MGFEEKAESQIVAALDARIAPAAEAILEELEALRVAIDVRYDSVTEAVERMRSASPEWLHEVIHALAGVADEEAQAAAKAAQAQAIEQAQACLKFEREQAKERLELVQSEAAAERESERTAQAALREELEDARAQVDVLRSYSQSQLETTRAELMQMLEASRAQTSAAREEAEQAAAASQQVVDHLRTQLEQALADLQQARAEADRIEQMVQAQPAVLSLVQDEDTQPDSISPAFRAIDQAATLTQVLDALLDGVGAVFPRAALFLVKPPKLQGWRSIGFESGAAITAQFEVPLATDSVLARAATTGRTIVSGGTPASESRTTGTARELWTVTLPVMLGDRVAAVVYGDEGARVGNEPPALDPARAIDVSQRLASHAAQRLAALAAADQTAGPSLVAEAPPTPVSIPTPTVAHAGPARQDEPQRAEGARRYARLLVSEIKRYRDAEASTGSLDSNLSDRLRFEIDRCRRIYAGRVPPEAASTANFFDEAVFEILGGDGSVLAEDSRVVGA